MINLALAKITAVHKNDVKTTTLNRLEEIFTSQLVLACTIPMKTDSYDCLDQLEPLRLRHESGEAANTKNCASLNNSPLTATLSAFAISFLRVRC